MHTIKTCSWQREQTADLARMALYLWKTSNSPEIGLGQTLAMVRHCMSTARMLHRDIYPWTLTQRRWRLPDRRLSPIGLAWKGCMKIKSNQTKKARGTKFDVTSNAYHSSFQEPECVQRAVRTSPLLLLRQTLPDSPIRLILSLLDFPITLRHLLLIHLNLIHSDMCLCCLRGRCRCRLQIDGLPCSDWILQETG